MYKRQEDACRADCTEARCGDGVVRFDIEDPEDEAYEECDDGDDADVDECLNNCREARCGDGVLRDDLEPEEPGFEACDDGNDDMTDACVGLCVMAECGDGYIQENVEECDDADEDNENNCANDCTANFEAWSGFRENVPLASFTDSGWSICHRGTYSEANGNLQQVINNCQGSLMMLACKQTNSETVQLAAYATKAEVTRDIGNGRESHHVANGVAWYYSCLLYTSPSPRD